MTEEPVKQPTPETKPGPEPDPVTETIQVKMNDARAAAQLIPVGERGYLTPKDFAQAIDVAKAMANSKEAVPQHVRGNLGMCIALYDIAMVCGFSPYMLANESTTIGGRLGFTSHVFRAIINRRAALRARLTPVYEGEGDEMTCTVSGHLRGELDPLPYTTPPLKEARPPRNDKGEIRGSPLWDKDPKRQLFYYASRAWARMYVPEAMLGIFGQDELQDAAGHVGAEQAIDVTSDVDALTARLKAASTPAEGFSHEHVEKVLNHKPKKKADDIMRKKRAKRRG